MERLHPIKEELLRSEGSCLGTQVLTTTTGMFEEKIESVAKAVAAQTSSTKMSLKVRRSIIPLMLKKKPSHGHEAPQSNATKKDENSLVYYDGTSEISESIDSVGELRSHTEKSLNNHDSGLEVSDMADLVTELRLVGQSGFDGVMENLEKMKHLRVRSKEEYIPVYFDDPDPQRRALDSDYDEIFTPVHFSISIQPRINRSLENKLFEYEAQRSIVSGEVGQKFPTALFDSNGEPLNGEYKDTIINGLYNFAKVPGSFEDLIELPGNSVTTVVS
ncbi:hypothetical protein BGZ60DRAFT_69342 [Tricladium varicosporioides]|nr:hypothetical protein BGZ60DRAFT_69342 [Hymenoscyphus varicosporioides]